MGRVVLTRADVAAKYDCNLERDVTIHAKGYSGKISNVNMEGAQHLIRSRSGYLTEKTVEVKPAGEQESTADTSANDQEEQKVEGASSDEQADETKPRRARSNANKNGTH